MKPSSASEHDEQDRKIIELLKSLGSFESGYPPQLLNARRAAFVAQVDQLSPVEIAEDLSVEDQKILQLIRNLKTTKAAYPPELLAARRAALLQQVERAGAISLLDEIRSAIRQIFHYRTPGFLRLSLALAGLLAAVLLGSLVFSRNGQPLQPAPSQAAVESTPVLPADSGETAIFICRLEESMPACPPGALDASHDLADQRNGAALPAVSKDARSDEDGVYKAAYVNDGRGGASWVSNSADSWIKIDLGRVSAINTVSLRKGSVAYSDNDPGQFVIAVALSDEYVDGDSSHDYAEYAQVFHSEQTGFSGTVSQTETIQVQFPSVRARFVKITFEKAGAAIEEIGVYMVEESTPEPEDTQPASTLTAVRTTTPLPIDTVTSTPTGTAVPGSTNTPTSSDTPPPLPTITQPPADTSTPVPTIPLPTTAPPTPIPPTAQPSPVSTDPIVVTGNDQTLTFTCNGNAAEIRGHANTVTLLGSCSSITVTGNGNRVYWEHGSPFITDRGRDNIIRQL